MLFHKLKSDIDVKTLYEEIDMNNGWEEWSPQMRGHGSAFKHTSIQRLIHHTGDDNLQNLELYSKYKNHQKFLSWFKETYGGAVEQIQYYKLKSKQGVAMHCDEAPYHLRCDRFHLVVSGNYTYQVEEERRMFNEHDLWWFDNKKTHGSFNNELKDKITLVIDVNKSNWRDMI